MQPETACQQRPPHIEQAKVHQVAQATHPGQQQGEAPQHQQHGRDHLRHGDRPEPLLLLQGHHGRSRTDTHFRQPAGALTRSHMGQRMASDLDVQLVVA